MKCVCIPLEIEGKLKETCLHCWIQNAGKLFGKWDGSFPDKVEHSVCSTHKSYSNCQFLPSSLSRGIISLYHIQTMHCRWQNMQYCDHECCCAVLNCGWASTLYGQSKDGMRFWTSIISVGLSLPVNKHIGIRCLCLSTWQVHGTHPARAVAVRTPSPPAHIWRG